MSRFPGREWYNTRVKTRILDGHALAEQHRRSLSPRVQTLLNQGKKPTIAAILFQEDTGSVLYTRLKKEMAESLGIGYEVRTYSLGDPLETILARVRALNSNPQITGIIIQKPWRNAWISFQKLEAEEGKARFAQWWHALISEIDERKDVDGLHPSALEAIRRGTWQEEGRVLPATCRSVLGLLEEAFQTNALFEYLQKHQLKTIILGKSDLLGQPLFSLLQSKHLSVEMIGSSELNARIEQKIFLHDVDIIVSATGRRKLITADLVKDNAVIIDAGEPQGDVDFENVAPKARAITPVPGGVGPMTVISLMENAVLLVS